MSNESVLSFAQQAMQENIAPKEISSNIDVRIQHAARRLGVKKSRAKSLWYADPSAVVSGAELKKIERVSGLEYARQELRSLDQIIADLDRLSHTTDQGFYRVFASALRGAATAIAPEIEGE